MKQYFILLLISISHLSFSQPFGSGELIVLNKSDHNVSFISLKNGKEVSVIEVGTNPHEVSISPNGKFSAVTNYGNNTNPGNTISIIDNTKRTIEYTHKFNGPIKPHGIEFINNEQLLFTTEGVQSLYIVDLFKDNYKIIKTEQDISHMVAYHKESELAFIANIGSGTVSVIDVNAKKKVKDIKTGDGAEGIAINNANKEVWVTNRENNTISIIDIISLTIKQKVTTENFPIRIKFTRGFENALVSCAKSGTVMIIDVKTKKAIKSIAIKEQSVEGNEDRLSTSFGDGPIPIGILIHPEEPFAFIANTNADIITVLDLSSYTIIGRINTRKEPDGLGYIR